MVPIDRVRLQADELDGLLTPEPPLDFRDLKRPPAVSFGPFGDSLSPLNDNHSPRNRSRDQSPAVVGAAVAEEAAVVVVVAVVVTGRMARPSLLSAAVQGTRRSIPGPIRIAIARHALMRRSSCGT